MVGDRSWFAPAGRRAANPIVVLFEIGDEFVVDVDLDNWFVGMGPECLDGIAGCIIHLAVRVAVEASKPLEFGLGLANLLGQICLGGLQPGNWTGRRRHGNRHIYRRGIHRESRNCSSDHRAQSLAAYFSFELHQLIARRSAAGLQLGQLGFLPSAVLLDAPAFQICLLSQGVLTLLLILLLLEGSQALLLFLLLPQGLLPFLLFLLQSLRFLAFLFVLLLA